MAETDILMRPLLLITTDRVLMRLIALECRELALPLEVSDTLPVLADERPILLDFDSMGGADAAATMEMTNVAGICRDISLLPAEVTARFSLLLERPCPVGQLRALLGQLGGRGDVFFADRQDYKPLALRGAAEVDMELIGSAELKVGDTTVHLSPSEAAIMRVLLANRGEVVGRDVLQECLKSNGAAESNKLEVYLCFLRRKIERPHGLRMITTVRGKGYRLE